MVENKAKGKRDQDCAESEKREVINGVRTVKRKEHSRRR